VSVRRAGGRSRLSGLRQRGSAKCLLPRVVAEPEAVYLNTAGGITGGDRFDYAAEAGAGARLTCTTQAAERVYRARPGSVGRLASRLRLGAGARLDWLPQETILFDGGALERALEVEMAEDATLLAVEPLVLGRERMGETVREGHFLDRWRIRRAGRLVFADTLRLTGPVAEIAARPGLWGANRAAASLLLVAPGAEERLAAARAALPPEGGASAWEGMLAARLLAPDGRALRRALVRLLTVFRPEMPRVWSL
jgi:urease accessory protein